MWWGIYLALVALNCLANVAFIPRENLQTYSEGKKPWDYYVSGGCHLALPITAWWTPAEFSLSVHLFGIACYITAAFLWIWTRRVNPCFIAEVIMPERIITTGPYHLNHPGYLALSLSSLGSALMLGSFWAFLPMLLLWLLLFRRAEQENRLLWNKSLSTQAERSGG